MISRQCFWYLYGHENIFGMLHGDLNIHLQAYILLLFGIMFKDVVPKHFIQFAYKIADADVDDVPRYKWGSAVLSETYHALCKCCTTVSG
jgi:hypothetical protein